jgi:hypothetical protein
MGLAILVEVERGPERRRVRPWVWALVAGFALALTGGLQVPGLRHFFEVVVPGADTWAVIGACAAAGTAALMAVRRIPALARLEAPPPG